MARESRRGSQIQRRDRSENGNARQTKESTEQGRRLISSRTPDLTKAPRTSRGPIGSEYITQVRCSSPERGEHSRLKGRVSDRLWNSVDRICY
jgi:hypothetical protein